MKVNNTIIMIALDLVSVRLKWTSVEGEWQTEINWAEFQEPTHNQRITI